MQAIPGIQNLPVEDDSAIRWNRFGGRQVFGRIFAIVWLVNLGSIWDYLRQSDLSTSKAVLGWGALALFVMCYVGSLIVGQPIWTNPSPGMRWVSRAAIATMTGIAAAFLLAARDANIAFVFIFAAVLAGLFLTPREAIRWMAATAVLLALILRHVDASWETIGGSLLIVFGIGVNAIFFAALLTQNRELRRARAEISRLAVSQERLRFARDLHDLLGQSLTLITLKSELAGRLLAQSPELAAQEIADIKTAARTSLQEVRQAVSGYRSLSLSSEVATARQMLEAAGVTFSADLLVPELSIDQEQALAWFVREGSTNVVRHSGASSAKLTVNQPADRLIAELIDDGGAKRRKRAVPVIEPSGNGLTGLRERIEASGGSLSIGAVPGYGFRLRAELPGNTLARVAS